jgi:RNA polymerase sigma factor (sigma-70 family)
MEEATLRYMQDADSYPLLTAKEERKLAATIRKFKGGKQKQKARERLINCNRKLVIRIAFRFQNYFNLSMMDIINTGNEGLVQAVDTYNPRKFKTRFSTYAYPLIHSSIYRLFYMFSTPVRIPTHIMDKTRALKAIMEVGREYTDEELMDHLQVSRNGLRRLRMAAAKSVSLDKEVGDSDKPMTLAQLIPDTKQIMSSDKAFEDERKEIIMEVLEEIPEKNKDIVMGLFYEGKTLAEVGDKFGITSEAVRQRKRKALRQLRKKLERRMPKRWTNGTK